MDGQKEVLKNQTVIIKEGKIKKIGPASKVKTPKGAQVIPGKNQYLMPGLTEMHAHIPVANEGDESYVEETLFLYLSRGVTTIRGMLGNPYHLELRKKVAAGQLLGPRIYTSSPSMNGNTVSNVAEAEEKVRFYKIQGYDFLKIHPGIQSDAMAKLVSVAKEVNMPFSGHVPAAVGIRQAIDYGYGTIDHLDGYVTGMAPEGASSDEGGFFGAFFTDAAQEDRMQELVQKTKAKGIAVVPTQTLFTRWYFPSDAAELGSEQEIQYMPAATRYQWRANKEQIMKDPDYDAEEAKRLVQLRANLIKAMYDAGVTILLGSDAPQVFNVPGFSIMHELEDMVDAGLPIQAVLESGTLEPARFFKAEGQYGSVKEGAAADLLLLAANPLEDISNIRLQVGVMVKGTWLPADKIAEKLKEIEAGHAN
jgi:imidazolonepropionase-like amidohydrolase